MASLGSRIGEFRKRRGVTQEQLAEAMGVTPQAVSKWENDISCPDISLLPKLADYFAVSLDVLIRGGSPDSVRMREEGEPIDINKMAMRIVARSPKGDDVEVNLPMPLLKSARQAGKPLAIQMMSGSGDSKISNALRNIDFDEIAKLAENGMLGKLLELNPEGGGGVAVFVE